MIALAKLLSPAPHQANRDATLATREVSVTSASQDPSALNEEAPSNAAASSNHPAHSDEPAPPNGSALSNERIVSSEPALWSDDNTLVDSKEHGTSPSGPPRSDKSVPKQTIHYSGQEWEYKGYKWGEPGILSLELKPVAWNCGTEFIREIEVHHDNSEGLLKLWKATPRPKPKDKKYEPLKIIEKIEDGRYRMQWAGFDTQDNTTLEPLWKIRRIAPNLLKEYRRTTREVYQTERSGTVSKRAVKPKPRRSRRRTSQRQ